MLIRSIRWRLQAWYGGLLIAVLIGFGWTALVMEQDRQLRRLDEELRRRASAISLSQRSPHPLLHLPGTNNVHQVTQNNHGYSLPPQPLSQPLEPIVPAGEPVRSLPEEVQRLFESNDSNGFYYAMWSLDRKDLARSPNAPKDLEAPKRSHLPDSSLPQARGSYREMVVATPRAIILVGRSMASDLKELRKTTFGLAGAGGVIWLFGLVGGWWLATRAIAPIQLMSETAGKIASGDLSQRIKIQDTENELGQLASVLNSTFARLEAAFAQQGRFTSDAAHELRTPLTVLLSQIQAALARPRQAEEYRLSLETCLRTAQRMRRLMESLLELARFDSGQELITWAPFSLAKMVDETISLSQPLAQPRRIRIERDVPDWVMQGDEIRLSQVLLNLVTNAIEYNRDGGLVRITALQKEGSLFIEVSDTGLGISAEHLPRLFERFYRVDPSRAGGRDHSGLGLAICKTIIETHGGVLQVSSQIGAGSTFTIALPGSCVA